ncbi:histidine kinase [Alicyclobacillus sp.]|uniref:sensor histidine kinase n=1 Tax=Alicyclobacillus sp. TaxID=61169 RepID=UPI0025BDB5AB|nr:histidine kinase [Alicyclobacillus sp.]MCL6516373.1 sensor histidine kinase [Alicyclobacillus sp.]
MTLRWYRVTLVLGPALIVLAAELIRHQFGLPYLSMERGNWLMAILTGMVIALFSQGLFRRYETAVQTLAQERAARAVMEERERLARALHDQIAQTLFSIGVQLETVRQAGTRSAEEEGAAAWEEIQMALREADENVRQVIFHLRQTPEAGMDLGRRLQALVAQTAWRRPMTWEVRMDRTVRLTPADEVQLFGIAQEAIANVNKHADAAFVSVSLSGDAGGGWRFEIRDDGRRFAPVPGGRRFGMQMMAERALEIGATLDVLHDETGTRVVVTRQEASRTT